jgi:hypothetical protein
VGCRGEAPEEEKTERVQGRSPWWVQKGKALDCLIIALTPSALSREFTNVQLVNIDKK